MENFEDYFWGDKHNGFNVLLLSATKFRQLSIKELNDFFKDVIIMEEEYQRHLNKLVAKVSLFGASSTFGLLWEIIRTSLTAFIQLHTDFASKINEVYKESIKYYEDHNKMQKQIKESELKTVEAVNLMQTTTTCLQKSKETYTTRFVEHEKLKAESLQKDLGKSENKLKKACEEYKHYVDKYEKVRNQFEERMVVSCKNFQLLEIANLSKVKQLLANYASFLESGHLSFHEAAFQMRGNMENLTSECLIKNFIDMHKTGTERPCSIPFEEPEPLQPPVPDSGGSEGGSISGNVFNNADSASQQSNTKIGQKMSLWLPGRKTKSNANNGSLNKAPNLLSPSDEFVGASKLAKSEFSNLSDLMDLNEFGNGDNWLRSAPSVVPADVKNDERFSDHGSSQQGETVSKRDSSDSSSDSDSDDETMKKLKITIREKADESKSSSVDQLRDAVKEIKFGKPGSRLHRQGESSFEDAAWQPFDSQHGQNLNATVISGRTVLRPAKTGDDWFNQRSFAGLQGPMMTMNNTSAMEPGEISESRDGLADLAPIVPPSTLGRPRPRSNTPTTQAEVESRFESVIHNELSIAKPRQTLPLAAALTETMHVLMRGLDGDKSPCNMKVYGSLTLSFPTAVVDKICAGKKLPLGLRFTDASKIHAIVPNCQVLPNQSSFDVNSTRQLMFSEQLLGEYLSRRRLASPNSPFYNVDVLRYEVRFVDHHQNQNQISPGSSSSGSNVPLLVQSFWKQTDHNTDLVVQYSYNARCQFLRTANFPDLLELTFTTDIGSNVAQAQLKPEGDWDKEKQALVWKLDQLGQDENMNHFFKARFTPKTPGTPIPPAATYVQFQVAGSLASATSVSLEPVDLFRLSMVKKTTTAGRYLCEPQLR